MSTMPPISSLGSAPRMIFSWPAASISAIQSRRSLLGTAMSPFACSWPSQRAHSDAARLNDGEMARPVVAPDNRVSEPSTDIGRLWHRNAHKNDATCPGQYCPSGEFAEVFIESEQNALLPCGPCQHIGIGNARRSGSYPNDVMSGRRKGSDRCAREVFISKEAHFRLRSGIPSPNLARRGHRRDKR